MQVRALLIGMVAAVFAVSSAQAMDVWQPPSSHRANSVRQSAPAYNPPPRYNPAPDYGPAPDYNAVPAYNPAAFNFDGFYLGAQGGGDATVAVAGEARFGLTAHRGLAPSHDIGDQRRPLHVDSPAAGADQLDAKHRRCRNAAQDRVQRVTFGGGAATVDKDVSA